MQYMSYPVLGNVRRLKATRSWLASKLDGWTCDGQPIKAPNKTPRGWGKV